MKIREAIKRVLLASMATSVIGFVIPMRLNASGAGTEGYAFLKIPVSARVIGMGENSAAVVSGAESLYHNPAGLTQTQGWQIQSHNLLSSEFVRMNSLSAASPIGKKSAFGVGVMAFSQPSFEGMDNAGNATGSFDATDLAASIGFAHQVGSMNLGGAVKVVQSQIANSKSQSFAVDIGMQKQVGRATVGASLSNLGPKVKFERESASLPAEAKLGVSYPVSNVTLTGEYTRSVNQGTNRVSAGAEYNLAMGQSSKLSLRSGFTPNAQDVVGNDLIAKGFRSGFGIQMKSLSVDYAISPFADLGLNHRISVGFAFGKTEVK